MTEEIKKVKEEYKSRGRSARRKKERELQKKYNNRPVRKLQIGSLEIINTTYKCHE